MREQTLLTEVLSEVRKRLPFPLLGFDTDNDSVFMNETVRDYCKEAGVEFTRFRPYRKNDQAWVEQKNGAVVRRIVGYRRYVGLEAAATLGRLYLSVRLFVNFFQPSFKLAEKVRDGAKVTKRYHPPATPYQRLLADPRASDEVRQRVSTLHATLDPVRLLSEIRLAQRQLVEIADRPVTSKAAAPSAPTLAQFFLGLRTSWQEGEVRPTSKPKKKVTQYWRRCPDPLETVAARMREWFEAEPWRTSRELLERLQGEHPGVYPDGQLRTVQRRVKDWRREVAHRLVVGTGHAGRAGANQRPTSTAKRYVTQKGQAWAAGLRAIFPVHGLEQQAGHRADRRIGASVCGDNGCVGTASRDRRQGSTRLRRHLTAREHFRVRQHGRTSSASRYTFGWARVFVFRFDVDECEP